jgi:tetratricopeptide (TPR) repeat protein
MNRHTPGHAFLAAFLILFLIPAVVFAQSSTSSPNAAATTPSTNQNSQAGSQATKASGEVLDAGPEAISKAMAESRFVDAQKLLTAAIEQEEMKSPSSQRLRDLLEQLGRVESQMGHYRKAVEAVERVMAMDRAQGGARLMMDYRGLFLYSQMAGEKTAAVQAAQQELALARENPGLPDPHHLLMALGDAVWAFENAHRTAEAQTLREETLRICQAQPNPSARPCGSILADFYRKTGHTGYAEETLSKQADKTQVYEGTAGYWPKVLTLSILARQYEQDQSYDLAEYTFRKAIAVVEAAAKDPAEAAGSYEGLGALLEHEARYEDAEAAYQHAFDLCEKSTGENRSSYIASLTRTPLADLYRKRGRVSDAETVLERVLTLQEKVLGPKDVRLAETLLKLAEVKSAQGESSEADALAERALELQEASYGPDSPMLIPALTACSRLARERREFDKAKDLSDRARRLNPYLRK